MEDFICQRIYEICGVDEIPIMKVEMPESLPGFKMKKLMGQFADLGYIKPSLILDTAFREELTQILANFD